MRIPRATYRLQFTPDFTFVDARRIVDYLVDLGVDCIYASPIFRPRKGSAHGYDVADTNTLNPELGSSADFTILSEEARRYGLGWLQDIVPNHMAFDAQNPMLVDLLENGPYSRYFRFFDIDWDHFYEGLQGRVLAPFLGSFYGDALEKGEIQLNYHEDGFFASYYDLRFPLRLETYLEVLGRIQGALRRKLGSDHPDHIQFLGVLYLLKTLATAPGRDRYDQIKFIKQTLWTLYQNNATIHELLDQTLEEFNGKKNDPASFGPLDSLLGQQFFRLSFWKVATEELNYRRFFSINDLISLRMEEREVFDHCHGLTLKLVRQGHFTGLRVDHIDGLYDPQAYLERLSASAPGCYLAVEKILDVGERLPQSWPIAGTTGYDFLNEVNSLFCQRANERHFTSVYNRFAEPRARCEDLAIQKKRLIVERHMMGDIDNLANQLKRFASRYRYGSDLTRYSLRRALIEIMVELPVYRTYLSPDRKVGEGRRYLRTALRRAQKKHAGLGNEFHFLERVLPLEMDRHLPAEEREQWTHFVMRFQQYTGPLMAKGFEDTLLYVYNRLLSLNEVGGSPERFGISEKTFHAFNQSRARHWPYTMNATASHDTKRGEDTRARLNVLSEIPAEWDQHLRNWNRSNRHLKNRVRRRQAPDRNDEYFLYQTLLATWPLNDTERGNYPERIRDYAIKAVREAKVHTNWLRPDSAYEEAYLAFVDALLKEENPSFLEEFLPFQEKIAFFGMLNGLAQALLKFTSPGTPDIYQGCELWDLSLVDPDNRRPVDYPIRRKILSTIKKQTQGDLTGLLADLRENWRDGRIKFYLTWKTLQLRGSLEELFRDGDYIALPATGRHSAHLIGYARNLQDQKIIVAVSRFATSLVNTGTWPLGKEIWEDSAIALPEGWNGQWIEHLGNRTLSTEGSLSAGDLFTELPVALLTQAGE